MRYEQVLPGGSGLFQCDLQQQQCLATIKSGRRCMRKTFRHPFCLPHARTLLGIDVRPSPGRGCGLFATQAFRPGDAIIPYTGETFMNESDMRRLQGRDSSPYVVRLAAPTRLVDATCLRGYAAYANAPLFRTRANVRFQQTTLTTSEKERLFRPEPVSEASGGPLRWRVLRTRAELGGHRSRNRLRELGFVRFPHALLDIVANGGMVGGNSQMWLLATEHIIEGTEILLHYGTEQDDICNLQHRTLPRPC